MRLFIIFLLFGAFTAFSGSFDAKEFFYKLDLNKPELASVRKEVQAGKYKQALDLWRDMVVTRLRERDFGEFGWHSYAGHPTPCGVVDMLIGRTSQKEYYSRPLKQLQLIDIYHMSGKPGEGKKSNWIVDVRKVKDWGSPQLDSLSLNLKMRKTMFGNFEFTKSFVYRYWESGNKDYRDKLFELYADFTANNFESFWKLYRSRPNFHDADVKYITRVDWRLNTNGLETGWRLCNFFKGMAGMVKCLGDDKPEKWHNILNSCSKPLTEEQLNKIDPVQLAQIAESAYYQHAPKLMWFCREGSVPNQRTTGLVALAFTTEIFPNFKHTPQIKAYLEKQLDDLLTGNYLPDGGSLEQSFNYNHGEIESLTSLRDFYGDKLPESLSKVAGVINARNAVDDGLQTPLGGLPQVGNHHDVLGKNIWESPAALEKYLKTEIRGKSKLKPQAYTSIAFPYSGFYVMRGGWDIKSPYLFFMNGRPQRGHSMRDNLAIQLTVFGRQMLVCGGSPTYGFNKNNPDVKGADFYLSEQSSLKNNTVIVDGKSQAKNADIATRALQTPVKGRWHSSRRLDLVDGVYDLGYSHTQDKRAQINMDVTHERTVIFLKDVPLWVVLDNMTRKKGKPHKFTQIWNFPPLVEDRNYSKQVAGFKPEQITVDAKNMCCGTNDLNGPNLDMYHFGPRKIDYKIYCGNREKWLGWFARGIGDAIPAPDLHVNWQGKDSDELITLLVPRDKGNAGPVAFIRKNRARGFTAKLRDGAVINVDASRGKLVLIYRKGQTGYGVVKGATTVTIDGSRLVAKTDCFKLYKDANGKWRTEPVAIPAAVAGDVSMSFNGEARPPDLKRIKGLKKGLFWRYASYQKSSRRYDIMKRAEIEPSDSGYAKGYSVNDWQGRQRFGLLFNGYLEIPEDGVYTFTVTAPNAALFIYNPERDLMGPPVVSTDYRAHSRNGSIRLKKGLHRIRIEFQHHWGNMKGLHILVNGKPLNKFNLFCSNNHKSMKGKSKMKKAALLAAAFVATQAGAAIKETSWTGAGNDNKWSTRKNWNNGLTHAGITAKIEKEDAVVNISGKDNIRCREVIIGKNATLNISGGSMRACYNGISVNGTLNITGGKVITGVNQYKRRVMLLDPGSVFNFGSKQADNAPVLDVTDQLYAGVSGKHGGTINLSGYGKITVGADMTVGRYGSAKMVVSGGNLDITVKGNFVTSPHNKWDTIEYIIDASGASPIKIKKDIQIGQPKINLNRSKFILKLGNGFKPKTGAEYTILSCNGKFSQYPAFGNLKNNAIVTVDGTKFKAVYTDKSFKLFVQ